MPIRHSPRRAAFVLTLTVVATWASLSLDHAHAGEEGAGGVRIERAQGPRRRLPAGAPGLEPRETPAPRVAATPVEPEDRAARGNGGNGM